jgi:hypothetical protein
MPFELVIAPEAAADIAEAYDWYEARRPGLGEDFMTSVDASMEAIRRTPAMCPLVAGDYRRFLVRRFPYALL